MNHNVHWNDIMGLDEAKRLLREAVVYPTKYPELFSGVLAPWKGVLLYGPPGTGKYVLSVTITLTCFGGAINRNNFYFLFSYSHYYVFQPLQAILR
jgi:SpoVK/Ycf46/Vps4 family AAA+-type ATPase